MKEIAVIITEMNIEDMTITVRTPTGLLLTLPLEVNPYEYNIRVGQELNLEVPDSYEINPN